MRSKRFDIKIGSSLSLLQKKWLLENRIKRYSWYINHKLGLCVSFKNEEDAMAFKLRWM